MSYPEKKKFPFLDEICSRCSSSFQIENDKELENALKYLMGDTYFEMRKLTSQLLNEIESMISAGKYAGYLHGEKLTAKEKQDIREVREDLKEYVRMSVEGTWREILNKQKIGMDKLSSVLLEHYGASEEDN